MRAGYARWIAGVLVEKQTTGGKQASSENTLTIFCKMYYALFIMKERHRHTGTINVLLVDDDILLITGLAEILESRGYSVSCSTTYEKALERVNTLPPDVCVIDLEPGIESSLDLLKDIQQSRPETVCAVITSLSAENADVTFPQCGGCDYIVKPIDETKFLNLIERCSILAKTKRGTTVAEHQLSGKNSDFEGVNSRLRALVSSARTITSRIGQDDLYHTICAEFRKQLDSQNSMLLTEENGRFTYCSSRDERGLVHSVSHDALKGSSVQKMLSATDPHVIEYKQTTRIDSQIFGADAGTILSVPLFIGEGNKKGLLAHIHFDRDILNDAILESCGLFGGLASDAIRASRRFREKEHGEREQFRNRKMEAIGRLAGGVAHDFNNLLTAITGYMELIKLEHEETPQTQTHIREMRSIIEKGSSLTQQLLAFSKRDPARMKDMDLVKVVQNSKPILDTLMDPDIEMTYQYHTGSVYIHADEGQIVQVLMSLVINARDAIKEKGRILVEVGLIETEKGSQALLTVRDTGEGMREQTVSRVFEPFFTTSEPSKGSGLGLFKVSGIMQNSSGWIDVDSTPGKGSVFTAHFPSIPALESSGVQAEEAETPVTKKGDTARNQVLVADDDTQIVKIIGNVLKKQEYTVFTASTSAEVVAILEELGKQLSLFITDVSMHGKDWKKVTKMAFDLNPELCLILVSGDVGEEVRRYTSGLNVSAVCMQKPFTPRDLIQTIHYVLE